MIRTFLLILSFFLCFTSSSIESAPLTCEERLKSLEPSEPKTIYDYELMPDRNLSSFKKEILPVSEIKNKGSILPYVTVYKNLNWQRPVYDKAWHSSYWRWSNVPINLANQQHNIFAYSGGLSVWYDLSNELALPANAERPSPINKFAFTVKYPYVLRLIIFKSNVTSVKYYKNQILVTGEPLRKGLTIVDIDMKNIGGDEKLLQLVTPDGCELDYIIVM